MTTPSTHERDAITIEEFVVLDPGGKELSPRAKGVPQWMEPNDLNRGVLASPLCAVIGDHLAASSDPFVVQPRVDIVPRVNACSSIRVPDLAVSRPDIGDDARWTTASVQVAEMLDSIGRRTPPRDFDRITLLHPGTAA